MDKKIKKIYNKINKELKEEKEFISDYYKVRSFVLNQSWFEKYSVYKGMINHFIKNIIDKKIIKDMEIKKYKNDYEIIFYNSDNMFISQARRKTNKLIDDLKFIRFGFNKTLNIFKEVYLLNNISKIEKEIVRKINFNDFSYENDEGVQYKIPRDILFIYQIKSVVQNDIKKYKQKIEYYESLLEDIKNRFDFVLKQVELFSKI